MSDYDLLVDFNDVDRQGYLSTLREFARPGAMIRRHGRITVGDGEGNRARATVLMSWRGKVDLHVDLDTFRPAS